MSAPDPAAYRAFALDGPDAAAAVAFWQVHAAFEGALEEGAQAFVVWLTGAPPPLPATLDVRIEERPVRAEDFAQTGLERDAVIHVTPDLLVRPPWVERPAGFDGVELVVPRGAAFGSGEHDSTKAALAVLHRTWSAPDSFADVGTGSGILALYAHTRGCRRLEACEIDAPSVAAARELLPAGPGLHARVLLGGPELLEPCAGVVANMTGDELRAAMAGILAAWTGRHELVLGGMRAHEVAGLVDAVGAARGARPVDREARGAFTAVALRVG